MMRSFLAATFLLLLAVLPAAGVLPKEAYFELDGVRYEYATGVMGSEFLTVGPPGEEVSLPFRGCVLVMTHPGTPNGRVIMRGMVGEIAPIDLYLEQFILPSGEPGYSYDIPVYADGMSVPADFAVSGNVTIRALQAKYVNPVGSTGVTDIDRDVPKLVGDLFISPEGVREDGNGTLLDRPVEDAELHMVVRSPPSTTPTTIQRTFLYPAAEPNTGVQPVSLPAEAFGMYHYFPNLKFGGRAVIDITFAGNAPAGMNELVFTVFDTMGEELANTSLSASAGNDDTATLEVPLYQFGNYVVAVNGSIAAAQYEVVVRMEPAADFTMHLWWEEVTYGHQAYIDYRFCDDNRQNPNEIVSVESVEKRPDPPSFLLKLVIVGIVAGFAVTVTAIKLFSDQVAGTSFRKSK